MSDPSAPMESLLNARRAELINQANCAIRAEARREVFAFPAVWCDRQHFHSAISHITPEHMQPGASRFWQQGWHLWFASHFRASR